MPRKWYISKVKGIAKIPDYIQIRDENFALLAYFRENRPDKALEKAGLMENKMNILNLVKELPFGKIIKFEL